MIESMQQLATEAIRSSRWVWPVLAPLLAAYAPWHLHKMYYDMHLLRHARRLVPFLDLLVTIDIVNSSSSTLGEESSQSSNNAYKEVEAYLTTVCEHEDALTFCAKGDIEDRSGFLLSLREGQVVTDCIVGVTVWWLLEKSCLRLTFPQQRRVFVLYDYLPHVRREGHKIMIGKGQRLYTNNQNGPPGLWSHLAFEHPATFDTLAMPSERKRQIMEDLDNFGRNEDYYRRIGKPWKRGYLLYGPPGIGKSTMIAAMANYLKYDIYDIELTSVRRNIDHRNLLVGTTGKSIIVIEDIDCSFDEITCKRSNKGPRYNKNDDEDSKVTLSGLLNFLDGVWSAQSGGRIIVLTTNFPDKLGPALIQSGRMDMHIEMSYCCFEAFKTLARNYLGVEAHPLFQRVEELLQVVEITTADVAECLLCTQTDFSPGSDGGVETCIERLIEELQKKAVEPAKKQRRRRH